MRRPAWLVLVALAALPALPVSPEPPDFVQSALARPILEPDQSLNDLRTFVEARLAKMPPLTTRREWEQYRDRLRKRVLEEVMFRGEAEEWREGRGRVEWIDDLTGGNGYRIRKLRYEALPGVWIPALLYEPEKLLGKVPVVLNVNGHDRTGKAADYKQIRCINQAKRGMLALNVEWFGMGQLNTPGYNHGLIDHLDLVGTSGIATHYLAMQRAIDLLLSLEHADPKRVAVTGLSGGGWQTIFISGLDPRVTLTDPVAGYSSFFTRTRHTSDLGDSEQTPSDFGRIADYSHLTAMMAPRPTLLTYNRKDDCCFASDHALPPLLDAAGPVFRLFGKEANLRSHVNEDPGTHNYLKDNRQALYRMLGDHFYPGKSDYTGEEIPCESELKTPAQLEVALPPGSKDFTALALDIARELPRGIWPALDRPKAQERLEKLVRSKSYSTTGTRVGEDTKDEMKAAFWKLRLGEDWTVPVVELWKGQPKANVLIVADGGRKSSSVLIQKHLDAGARVFAVDPLYLGESTPGPQNRAFLWSLLTGTVGERPLGLQASQLAAVARWIRETTGSGLTLSASGARSTTSALVAAAVERPAIRALELEGALGSLKEPLEKRTPYSQAPELFCFGLLREFDIQQLKELAAPRPVRLTSSSQPALDVIAGERPPVATCGCESFR